MKNFKSFVLMCLLAICVALTGVFGSLNAAKAQSYEVSAADGSSNILVEELWNAVTKRFYESSLKTFLGLLTSTEEPQSESLDDLYSTLETQLNSKTFTAQEIKEKNDKNIEVKIGGLNWQVVFVSTDTQGEDREKQNIIVTLWLSSYQQDAWEESNTSLGDYYGIVNAGGKYDLYSDWCADSFIDSSGEAAEHKRLNDYYTSYIRAVTLNNGGEYVNGINSTATYEKSKDSIFAPFTYKDYADQRVRDALIDHIVSPANVYWQKSESMAGYENLMNENSVQEDGSATWGNDYLWLPSFSETGSYATEGIWHITAEQRENHCTSETDSVTLGGDQKAGSKNNYQGNMVYLDTCLRTSNSTSDQNVTSLYYKDDEAHTLCDMLAASSYVCRPAFNLNLKSAKDKVVDPKNISSDEGGNTLAEGFSLNIAPYNYLGGAEIDLTSEDNLKNIDFRYIASDETKVLVYNEDFLFEVYSDVTYETKVKPVEAGTYYIELIGIGNYTGKYRYQFSVDKIALSNSKIKVGNEPWKPEDEDGTIEVPYIRSNYTFTIYVFDTTNKEPVPGEVYKIEYKRDNNVTTPQDFTNAGTIMYTISINTDSPLSRNYDETHPITGHITIKPREIEDDSKLNVEILNDKIIYNGYDQTPDYKVTYTWGEDIIELANSIDYIGTFSDNKEAGQGKLSIRFIGNYSYKSGEEVKTYDTTFEILKEAIAKIVLYHDDTPYEVDDGEILLRLEFPTNAGYTISVKAIGTTGDEIASENLKFTWTGEGKGAKTSSDETVLLKDVCTEKLSLRISDGNLNYTDEGEFFATIEIYAKTLNAEDIRIEFGEDVYTYNDDRTPITPKFDLFFGGTPLISETDYTSVITGNVDAGVASINITLTGNYTSAEDIVKTFTISPRSVDVSRVEWNYDNNSPFVFNGDEFVVTLKEVPQFVKANYLDNAKIHAGVYTAKVSFEAADDNHIVVNENLVYDLTWEIKQKEVNIDGASFEGDEITFDDEYHLIYVKDVPEGVKVTYVITNDLENRVDAKVGCRDVGSYNFQVTFSADNNEAHSDYILRDGDANVQWNATLIIKKLDMSLNQNLFNISLASKTWGYTGKDITPTVIITWRGTNKTLRDGVDYYISYENNREIGKNAKAIVHGIGNYDGQMEEIFEISVTGGGSSTGEGGGNAQADTGSTNIGLIIGVFAGIVAVFAVVIVVVVVVLKKRRNRNSDDF